MYELNRCLACKRCGTDAYVRWKTIAEATWWVACDGCGGHGPPGDTQRDAGIAWNRQQR